MRPWIIVGSFIFKQITHSLNILMEIYYFKNKWELLYKEKVKDILVDRELLKAPPMKVPNLQDKAVNTIRQCLVDEMMYNVMCEKRAFGLWSKLEKFYMTNNLYNKCSIL